ncbi:MAG: PAS domain S-box protein [Syntrophobacteraceae bacterium]
MFKGWPAARHRIVLWMILPVFFVGLTISALSVYFWTKPVISFIESRTEAELALASSLGIKDCEGRLSELLGLRLENDSEMVASMRSEAIKEVIEIGKKFSQIHMMIVQDGETVVASSIPDRFTETRPPALTRGVSPVIAGVLGGEPVRMQYRYFPFWRWHIVSFIFEKDYMGPIQLAKRAVYLVSLSVLLLMTVTIFFLFDRMVNRPLDRIIRAAEGVAQGRYAKVRMERRDEIGRVAQAFDSMVGSLEDDKDWIHAIMAKLKESEERYRLLTENSLANIIMVQDGRFIYTNRTTIATSGYAADELYHMDILEFVHPDDRELVRQKISDGLEDDKVAADRYEFRYLTKQGETRWLEMLAVPSLYKGKAATLGHAIDITDKKLAQDEHKNLQQKLQQAQKMEALGTIVGAVAHDLNNILAGLVGYPDLLLLQMPAESPYRRYILAIQQSGQKAAAIVQDLLTMVRRGVVVKEVINFNSVVLEYLQSPQFEKMKGFHPEVAVETDIRPDLLNILGSRVHLFKTVMNLVSNAAEACPNGGMVLIRTENRYVDTDMPGEDGLREGDYVVLIVSDNGVGISEADMARIFEPFYTKKVLGRSGTGLGMAVVLSTVKDHLGQIRMESEEGSGTKIELYFPATRENPPHRQDGPTFETRGGSETILVVDDVKEQRELAREMLSGLGYTVHVAASGEEAVEFFKNKGSADLLVLDMIMDPGIDGLETYKRILDLRPSQKAIIASGFSETDRIRDAQRLGAKTLIVKPYTLEKLATTVRRELDKASGSNESKGA